MNFQMVDRLSYYIAFLTIVGSTILFYRQTGELLGSFVAAIIAGGLAWIAYVLTRWLVLSLRK